VKLTQVANLGAVGAATSVTSAALDGVSTQLVSSVVTQKSEVLVGAVAGSNFTTTSSTLVDVTGMTVTLAATSSVASKLSVLGYFSESAGGAVVFSLNSAATNEYTWFTHIVALGNSCNLSRNADLSFAPSNANQAELVLLGHVSGATSGVVVKVQVSIAAAATLTVFIGTALRATF
jgi:hypothetical protein